MKKRQRIWNAKGEWYITTWYERKKGGKRRFLKTREATIAEVAAQSA